MGKSAPPSRCGAPTAHALATGQTGSPSSRSAGRRPVGWGQEGVPVDGPQRVRALVTRDGVVQRVERAAGLAVQFRDELRGGLGLQEVGQQVLISPGSSGRRVTMSASLSPVSRANAARSGPGGTGRRRTQTTGRSEASTRPSASARQPP
jgi:hypothetical protein